MIQKQTDYYHARFHFSPPPKSERGIAGAAEKLLQQCKYRRDDDPPLSLSVGPPMRFYMIPQLFEWLTTHTVTMKSTTLVEPQERNDNKYAYYHVELDQTDRVIATLQSYPNQILSLQFHYHSLQFDEYYMFACAYPKTIRSSLFWNRQQALEEICHRLRERNFQAIDYSTLLIPE